METRTALAKGTLAEWPRAKNPLAAKPLTRREFAGSLLGAAALVAGIGLWGGPTAARADEGAPAGSDAAGAGDEAAGSGTDAAGAATEGAPLPPASVDPASDFGVDANVNVSTIDEYLGLPGVAYRDMRMIFDPADWESMGQDPYLSTVLEGFTIVPYPFLGTLPELPVGGAYDGDTLFTVTWEDGEITGVTGNYRESLTVLRDLFPKDRPIVLVCGGGGYAGFTKKLLTYLGWDPELLYNAGGMWDYAGERTVELIDYGRSPDDDLYAIWRADYAVIDFTLMRPESVRYNRSTQ